MAPDPGASVVRHWLLLAGGLLLAVLALLTGGYYAAQHFRGSVGTQPAPSVAAPASPAQSPALAASVAPAPVASTAPSAVASASPSLRVATDPLSLEIEQAYLHYWDVRTQAYLNLDTSHLGEVMAGAELTRETQNIKDWQAQGRAGKLDVDHHILLAALAPDRAVVYDEYLNRSTFLDAASKKELPTSSPPVTEKISYDLQKIDGTWKVIGGQRND